MGLPAKWHDPKHGWCLRVWAAIAHLEERGMTDCKPIGHAIRYRTPNGETREVRAVYVPAADWVYPLSELEAACQP
ncbi:MAG: hypothetical protein MUF87_03270 [Anaerolineae bacterium]|jgi:hypothetical protein|nr:hypothetical protein [Anaerolineae bacterium]